MKTKNQEITLQNKIVLMIYIMSKLKNKIIKRIVEIMFRMTELTFRF